MKLFAKLLIAIAVIAILLPFTILKDETGNTLLSFPDIALPDLSMPDISLPGMPDLSDSMNTGSSAESMDGKDIFYKWYDDKGDLHFTSEPPAPGVEYIVKGYDPDANVIQAVKIPPKAVEKDAKVATPTNAKKSGNTTSPYSSDSIQKLFEDARNIEKLLDQRAQKQDYATSQ